MTLDGHVEKGHIVLDETATLPEGAKVRIEVLSAECPIASEPSIPTLCERLRNVVGKAKGHPADAASVRLHFKPHPVGPADPASTYRREDIYGDDGR